jgi:molybdopterin molybdotransferase
MQGDGLKERVLRYRDAEAAIRAATDEALAAPKLVSRISLTTALGRVLAEPVRADRDQPPFARSTRDGFAVRMEDLPGPLRVAGQLRAGEIWRERVLRGGEAVEIMTGAAVPEGANAVVMVEHVEHSGDTVRLMTGRRIEAGENVVPAGAEARAGDLLVDVGTRLGPAQVAAAAAAGYAEVEVYARTRVAILATGDELVEVEEQPKLAEIRNSNSYSLAAQVAAMGAEAVRLPLVKDELEATEQAIRAALACDLVVITGGVSMGKFDFVEQALKRIGAEAVFTGARIQPGKPVVFGRAPHGTEKKFFLGLPGNPVSTMVTFALFASPLVAALSGETDSRWPRWTRGRLTAEARGKEGLTRFVPAMLEGSMEGVKVTPRVWQGSGDVACAARADGYAVVPDGVDRVPAGADVSVLLIGGL